MALQPEVSIVVPVHNHWALTARCLLSLAEEPAAVGFEVIVVDDASTDETPARLAEIVGIWAVRLDENRGFLGAVNCGIEKARGRYVVLLNNDTVVQPGWLDALVDTADDDPSIGVVGAKLIYPDGRLQEAGGVIFEDGTGCNYGRGDDPDDQRYDFVRDVDYCSGACLLVRHELLRLLGGLDTGFAPAYYEDTDLCFAARAHGYRVVYQPEAVVLHDEGGTHGTDISAGVKRHQEVNRSVFAQKWADVLSLHGRPDRLPLRAAAWRTAGGHCLVIDHALPMPDRDSGSRRMSELLGILSDLGFAVTFVPFNGIDIPVYRRALTSRGVAVLHNPADIDAYIADTGPALRVAILSRPTIAWTAYPMLRSLAPGVPVVYDTVDLHHVRERRRSFVNVDSQEASAAAGRADFHYGMEISLARLVEQVWVVSDAEARTLAEIEPTLDVAVVPNVHRPASAGPGFAPREGLLFVGNYNHEPNGDAAGWLVAEILPLVRDQLGEVPVYLAGSDPTPEVMALAGAGVQVLGWVPNLEDLYHRCRIFVAPLRYGAGMKGKIGEAGAFGLPVVTTSIGAEGMGLVDGEHALIRDDAPSFAEAVAQAYRDSSIWGTLATGVRRAMAEFTPDAVRPQVASALKRAGVTVPGA